VNTYDSPGKRLGSDITKWLIAKYDGRWAVCPPMKLKDGTLVPAYLLDGHSFDTFDDAVAAFTDRLDAFRRVVVGE